MKNHSIGILTASVLSSGLFVLTGQQPIPGVFTAAQAEAGRAAYANTCGKCHTATLLGRKGDPGGLPPISSLSAAYQKFIGPSGVVRPLTGPAFLDRWGEHTVADLARQIQETVMSFPPEGADDETGINITAYVLQVNGAKPGTQRLTWATEAIVKSITADQAR